MGATDPKADLERYLRVAHEALVWKLDGLSEYDVRRPLVATGTNLLGIVKHVASVEAGYLGDVFDRPFAVTFPWFEEDAESNADMWATADESREYILGLHEQARAHATATIDALDLDDVGRVPWWAPDNAEVTLHQVLIHLTAEVNRHAGHADILRELIDGAAGLRAGVDNLPQEGADWWVEHHDRIEAVAAQFKGEG